MYGHYSLPLINMLLWVERTANVVLHHEAFKKCSRVVKRMKAEKLHRQFTHVSKEKLISLVRGSNIFNDKEFLDRIWDVYDSCSVCLTFRKPPL